MRKQLILLLSVSSCLMHAQGLPENLTSIERPSERKAGITKISENGQNFERDHSTSLLLSPVLDLSSIKSPTLSFNYTSSLKGGRPILKAEVYNGTKWIEIFSSEKASKALVTANSTSSENDRNHINISDIDLAPYVQTNFRIRFFCYDNRQNSSEVVLNNVTVSDKAAAPQSETKSMTSSVQIYPNPIKDYVYINDASLRADYSVTIADMSGNVVASFKGASEGYNLSGLSKGVYLMIIDNGKEKIQKKIIKE
ncbi:T9SS type A sorting domain-containing protein [Chryseobacterium limigenitum]|uniref:Por secretion system C-terminal sorting domain-containing protein n=1 Tax=Chryseobacterium limigenitum TaxID=1612149 RepID=A0A1K2IXA6_9FLAO|nr:T9SS type A sorting domain-containing protein [Chryseobacterium limigenitum]SFZ97053.1 Por secretion system C-terminal sorting domain-containing protein [Chryseobacterium limigenitum]